MSQNEWETTEIRGFTKLEMSHPFPAQVRIWHLPSSKATAWAHLNDCVTTIGARAGESNAVGSAACARVAVGTRGGQMFVYKSRGRGAGQG